MGATQAPKAQVNHERVTQGFNLLTSVLAPFVCRELEARYKADWWKKGVLNVLYDAHSRGLPGDGPFETLMHALDAARCLILIDQHWNDLFRIKLSREHRTWVKELVATRNKWAHKGLLDMNDEDAWRAIDTMTRLTEPIDAEATERLRELAREVRYGTRGPSTEAATAKETRAGPRGREPAAVLKVVPRSGLLPWRDVAQPHPDVAAGRYRQAEFVADLSQVARGTAEPEYQDPVEFFARTYVTSGMKALLVQALKRATGQGGEPVIQLKTAFGGGKTHTLLALYHLLRGRAPAEKLDNVRPALAEAGLDQPPQTCVAVLVGTALNPTKERRPPQLPGITIRTLWGEIGAQLADQAGDLKLFDFVREADRKAVPPGSEALVELMDAAGPCLILIDELLAYARKIYGIANLPGGSFDAVLTFVQELTEAVRVSKRGLLVATIPESDIEIGGEAGIEALRRLEHTFGRMEAVWKPVGAEEGFEVVRRRLFLPIRDQSARDDACRAFSQLYRDGGGDFPSDCKELAYLERLKGCYPIHPELFDRLYGDWAALERFQRTRGVLRLMAALIHDLWIGQDASVMIMPGSLAVDAAPVRDELLRYLPEAWSPVVERDVDGQQSLPRQIDSQNPYFGQVMAARRVARTVFLGSAPHVAQQQVRGLEEVRIRLGIMQPGETVSVFNDALGRLKQQLTYLYHRGDRYWYDARPNLGHTVKDRAQQMCEEEVETEIERRLRQEKSRGDFAGVHLLKSPTDLPEDDQSTRLVVLRPSQPHKLNEAESPAVRATQAILETRGTSPRQYKNMLAFIAPDRDAVGALDQEVRRYLAWASVLRDQDSLNLDRGQQREATEGVEESNKRLGRHLEETYSWLLLPHQEIEDGELRPLRIVPTRIGGAGANHVTKASQRMRTEEALIVRWSPALLRLELDRWFWKDQDHVGLRRVWVALCSYCYLPRLRDTEVFLETVREGLRSNDFFGYAQSVAEDGRYLGLVIGQPGATIYLDAQSVLVKTEAALRQLESEPVVKPPDEPVPPTGDEHSDKVPPTLSKSPTAELRRFHGTVGLDPRKLGPQAGTVALEVVQHLAAIVGSQVEVTLDIQAELPNGTPEHVVRTVTENCRTLRFISFDFESE